MSLPGKRRDTKAHQYVEDRLSAFLDGQLSNREQSTVERHLEICEDCRWNLDTLRRTVQWTRELPVVSVPRVFTIPVTAPRAAAPRWRWSLPLLQGATALVALLFFFVFAGDFMLTSVRPGVQSELAAPQPAVESAPAMAMATGPVPVPEAEDLESAEVAEESASEKRVFPTEVTGEQSVKDRGEIAGEPDPTRQAVRLLEKSEAPAEAPTGSGEMEMMVVEAPVREMETAGSEKATAEGESLAPSLDESGVISDVADAAGATVPTPVQEPTVQPTRLPPSVSNTVVAEVREAPQQETAAEEWQPGAVQRDPMADWLDVAQTVFGLGFVLLAMITIFAMVRKRRAS